jgi:hypothetical protein
VKQAENTVEEAPMNNQHKQHRPQRRMIYGIAFEYLYFGLGVVICGLAGYLWLTASPLSP